MKFLPSKKTFRAFSKYFLFGAAVFAVGLVWNFPLEKISQSFTQRLAKQSGYQFKMDTLDPALPIGFKATNFKIDGLGKEPLIFSSMRITVSPFSLLTYPFKKSLGLAYAATKDKAVWEGTVELDPTLLAASLVTQDWRLNEEFPLDDMNPMLAGSILKVKAKIAVTTSVDGESQALQKGDLTKANGDFRIVATNASLDVPLTSKQLRFDKVEAKGTLKEGKLTIESISLIGPDISGTANGTIKLSPYFPRSRLQLEAKLKISEKAGEVRSLIENFGGLSNLRIDGEGNIALKITGPVTPVDRWNVRGY